MTSTVLVAENDCTARGLLSTWLQDAGYTCLSTGTEGAWSMAAYHRPQAVLVGAGAECQHLWLARALRRAPIGAAVIVMSEPSLEIALEAARCGAADCLPWPSSPHGVVESVRRAVSLNAGRLKAAATFDVD